MASIKTSSSTVNQKTIKADIAFKDGILMYRTEEMNDFEVLETEVKYFDGKFTTVTFKEEIKSEELPESEVAEED